MAGFGSSARPAPPVNGGGGGGIAPLPSMGSPIPPARRPSAPMAGMARPGMTPSPQMAPAWPGMARPGMTSPPQMAPARPGMPSTGRPGEVQQEDWDTMASRKVGDTMPNGYTITDRKVFANGSRELEDALARIRSGGRL